MIYYLIGDYAPQSWGNGMIYEHVRILRDAGYDACALHHHAPFRPQWLEIEVPIHYIDESRFAPTREDIVVVPEVLAESEVVQKHPWRRFVFVQGSFLIFRGLQKHEEYSELGYEAAIAILPHVARVVTRHFGIEAEVVPPFVAPQFFEPAPPRRDRRVLLTMKEGYRALGISDQEIAERLLRNEIDRRSDWSLTILEGFTHTQVAELMRTSLFLVNVFSHEAFNTTVPEAMAAGCIPICYDARGGADFLEPEENAIVYPNQHVYEVVERVCDLIDHPDNALFERIRRGGRKTASSFNRERTAGALTSFFAKRLHLAPR